jgi:hypothetical protein
VLIAGAALATGCGNDDAAPAAPSVATPPAATITTPPTTPPVASAQPPGPTTPPSTARGPNGGCVDVPAGAAAAGGVYAEHAYDRFGPLDTGPTLTIQRPVTTGDEHRFNAARIDGGILVTVSHTAPRPPTPADQVLVAAVNHDGTLRWSRCLDGYEVLDLAVAAPAHQPAHAVLVVVTDHSGDRPHHLVQLALDTGAEAAASALTAAGIDDPDGFVIVATTDRYALLADQPDDGPLRRLVRYDLATDTAVDVGVPAELTAVVEWQRCRPGIGPVLTDAGDVFVADVPTDIVAGVTDRTGAGPVVALWHDGSWTRDPDVLVAAVGPRPGFACADDGWPGTLHAVDAAGRTVWSDPTASWPMLDDGGWYLDGDVAIGQICTARDDGGCGEFALAGYDAASGGRLWALPGARIVASEPADGYALVWDNPDNATLEPTAWILVDDRTGRAVPGQRFKPEAFTLYPSREVNGFNTTNRAGGLILVVAYDEVRVWYPAGLGGTPHTLQLD